jgi:hypothetical protein
LIGHQASDGRLARAHKANESDVNNAPRGAHRDELDDLREIDTQFLTGGSVPPTITALDSRGSWNSAVLQILDHEIERRQRLLL